MRRRLGRAGRRRSRTGPSRDSRWRSRGRCAAWWLERARQSAPTNPEVLRAVAGYYRDTGDYASAIQVLQSLRTKDPATLSELAYSYQLAGDKHSAAETYLKAAAGDLQRNLRCHRYPDAPCSVYIGKSTAGAAECLIIIVQSGQSQTHFYRFVYV